MSSFLQSHSYGGMVSVVSRDHDEVLHHLLASSKGHCNVSCSPVHLLKGYNHQILIAKASLFHRHHHHHHHHHHRSDEQQQQQQIKPSRPMNPRARNSFASEPRKIIESMVAGNDDDDDNGDSLTAGMNIFDRLALAWTILFPKRKMKTSPAQIAKQRLRMILISDRCSVNDSAKRKIVKNIVGALADFVEIEPQDRVRLNVCADPELGTVYSVSVPVRRVRPQFQDEEEDEEEEGDSSELVSEEEEMLDQFMGEGLTLNSSSSDVEPSYASDLLDSPAGLIQKKKID